MKVFTYSLLFLAVSSAVFGNSQLDSLLDSGREYSYQFDFQKAESVFQNLMNRYPNSPYASHYLSQNYLWFYIGSKDSLYKEMYEKYSEETIANAEVLIDKDDGNPKLNNLIGQYHLLKSMFYANEGNSMDAFWSIKSSVSYFEDAVELDQNYYEPYLGLGTIRYALSFVPGFLGWAITITGLSGDKEEGLRLIKLAYDKSQFSRTEASYHLSKVYTEYNAEFDSAKIYLKDLLEKYPHNILFLYQYAILLVDTKELEKAKETLKIIIDLNNEKFSQTTYFSIFLQAEIAFKQNDFISAINLYEKFLTRTKSIDYTGLAYLKIGLCHDMLNDNLIAKKYYILARNGNQDIPEDIKAHSNSYLYYDRKFSENDKSLILAENYSESGNYPKAIETITMVDKTILDFDDNLKINIINTNSNLMLGEYQLAKNLTLDFQNDPRLDSSNYGAEYYLVLAKVMYHEGSYSYSKKYLNSAFENCEKSNNKLIRHLVNLKSKLDQKNR